MLQISEKIRQKKRRFWNNYQHFMKRGYSQMFIKKGTLAEHLTMGNVLI